MYKLVLESRELFDENKQEFIEIPETILNLEHSLISISKWESKYHKPFLSQDEKTINEIIDYVKCMTINNISDDSIYNYLTDKNVKEINDYIKDPMTATWIKEQKKYGQKEIITSELIYYWMIAYQIPFECQKWHINRLMMLIRVCGIKNEEASGKSKKMSKSSILRNNKALNDARKAKYNTKG